MTKKRLIALLAASLSLALCIGIAAGCAQQSAAGNAQSAVSADAAATSAADEVYGTIILRLNPEIAVSYDKHGNVVKVEGLNDDGRALVPDDSAYRGQACRAVVETLLGKFNEAGYLAEEVEGEKRQVQIELSDGSHVPAHNFLNDIVEGADAFAYNNQVNAAFALSGTTDYGWSYYDDTDYGPSNDGYTDYGDTDFGPVNDGITNYNITDYGPDNDGVTDFADDDTDYGKYNDGVTDYSQPAAPAGGSGDSGYTNYGDSVYAGGGATYVPPASTPAPAPAPAPAPTPSYGGDSGYSDYGNSSYGGSGYGDSGYDD